MTGPYYLGIGGGNELNGIAVSTQSEQTHGYLMIVHKHSIRYGVAKFLTNVNFNLGF